MGIMIKVKIKHGSQPQTIFNFTIDENDTLIPVNPEDRIMDVTKLNILLGTIVSLKRLMESTTISLIEIEKE